MANKRPAGQSKQAGHCPELAATARSTIRLFVIFGSLTDSAAKGNGGRRTTANPQMGGIQICLRRGPFPLCAGEWHVEQSARPSFPVCRFRFGSDARRLRVALSPQRGSLTGDAARVIEDGAENIPGVKEDPRCFIAADPRCYIATDPAFLYLYCRRPTIVVCIAH